MMKESLEFWVHGHTLSYIVIQLLNCFTPLDNPFKQQSENKKQISNGVNSLVFKTSYVYPVEFRFIGIFNRASNSNIMNQTLTLWTDTN